MLLTLFLVLVVAALVGALVQVRRANAASLANQRMFSQSFHASPIPLALTSLVTHKITEVNHAYEKMMGWSRLEMIGRSGAELGMYAPELREKLAHRLRRTGTLRDYPVTMTGKDGLHRYVIVAMDIIVIDGEMHSLTTVIDQTEHKRTIAALHSVDERLRELAETIDQVFWVRAPSGKMLYVSPAYEKVWGRTVASLYEQQRTWVDAVLPEDREKLSFAAGATNEFRITRPDGGVRWVRTKSFPVHDAHGNVIRVAGVASDVTEQRELEDHLRQAQKMESLGMLAGGIAHDFNNLLAVISSCSGLLAETIDATSPDHELVDDISDAVVRAAALTRQLLAFSRKQVSEPVVLDLNLVVTDTRKLLRRMLGVDVEVESSLEPELRTVRIDRSQLVQVILNLAVNGRDAMRGRGVLKISTRNCGDDVVLSVSDNGSGMTPDVVARACEPFFTTKEQGKGTGMGLAVVHGIIDHADGRIEIDSTVGIGTTFRITLPAVGERVEAPRPTGHDGLRGVETILLVDDDDYVRRATARALRSRGYTIIEAGNGRAALASLPAHDIDLLLTDIVMPGMNGRIVAECARTRMPALRVLFMTGYTDDQVVHSGLERGEVELIEKPFTIPALAAKVRAVLDAEPVGTANPVGLQYTASATA